MSNVTRVAVDLAKQVFQISAMNDVNDADGIAEASTRPSMRVAGVKSVEQQHIQQVHRARQMTVRTRTARCNQLHGPLDERVLMFDEQIAGIAARMPACKRVMAAPGIGVLTATVLVAVLGDPSEFRNGREMAAWLGLVPRQRSTGGRPTLLGISKRGDRYVRTLLIHGARSPPAHGVPRLADCSRRSRRRGLRPAAIACRP